MKQVLSYYSRVILGHGLVGGQINVVVQGLVGFQYSFKAPAHELLMSTPGFTRDPFPHENDADFERVLRNISQQELMARPTDTPAPMDWYMENVKAFIGDTWHWSDYSLWSTWPYYLLALKSFGSAVFIMTNVIYVIQPVPNLVLFTCKYWSPIFRYTFFLDKGLHSSSSYRRDMVGTFKTLQLRHWTYKEILFGSFKVLARTAPVFAGGAWIGAQIVWTAENHYGEDGLVRYRQPIQWGTACAATILYLWKRGPLAGMRGPFAAFSLTFAGIWCIDTMFLRKEGVDAIWNPAGVKLPPKVVEIFSGEPFNGQLIVGPIKYLGYSLIDTIGLIGFYLTNKIPQALANKLVDIKISEAKKNDTSDRARLATIEEDIKELEYQALLNRGMIDESVQQELESEKDLEAFQDSLRTKEEFRNSFWNFLGRFESFQDRLSPTTKVMVSDLFPEKKRVVDTWGIAKPVDEMIFGDLVTSVENASEMSQIEAARQALRQASSNAQYSDASPDVNRSLTMFVLKGHHDAAIMDKETLGAVAWNDPLAKAAGATHNFFGTLWGLWNPVMLYFSAFDDRREHLPAVQAHLPLKKPLGPVEVPPMQNVLEKIALKIEYPELPPLIPQHVAQEQVARFESEQQLHNEIAQLPEEFQELKENLKQDSKASASEFYDLATGLFSHLGTTARTIFQEDETKQPTYIPDDDFFQALKKETDQDPRVTVPAAVTEADRLRTYHSNIAGQDFKEVSEGVARAKLGLTSRIDRRMNRRKEKQAEYRSKRIWRDFRIGAQNLMENAKALWYTPSDTSSFRLREIENKQTKIQERLDRLYRKLPKWMQRKED